MLSGGNPVGGQNPSGIGTSLNYIGKHAYAYSGIIAANNVATTTLKFETGAEYIVAVFQAQYFSDNNDVYLHTLTFNSEAVVGFEFNGSNNADGAIQRSIIIPPFTKVLATAKNTTNSTTDNVGATITGEVYA
jgi:hypothetical protein